MTMKNIIFPFHVVLVVVLIHLCAGESKVEQLTCFNTTRGEFCALKHDPKTSSAMYRCCTSSKPISSKGSKDDKKKTKTAKPLSHSKEHPLKLNCTWQNPDNCHYIIRDTVTLYVKFGGLYVMLGVIFIGISIQILALVSAGTPRNMLAMGIAQTTNVQLKLNYSQSLGGRRRHAWSDIEEPALKNQNRK